MLPAEDGVCRRWCRCLYSCRRRQRSAGEHRWPCCWFSIVFLGSLLALFWMYVCAVAFNDRDDVNWKAFTALKRWINWFMVLVIVSAVLAVYCCLLLVLLFLALVLIGAGIAGICVAWRSEWATVRLSLQATAPFLQLGGVGALILLSWFIFQRIFSAESAVSKRVTLLVFVLVSIVILLCPLFINSPCLLEKLPPKPDLIGHRGAPMLAPENTMMSFRRSLECDLLAFETDVQISKDKVPFLLHDHKGQFLLRTTNVNEVYKGWDNNRSSHFTWEELQALNAGEWFIKSDPFGTASSLSKREVAEAQNQSIPALAELLELAKQTGVSVIFDMKSHRRDGDDVHHTVEAILRSNISADLVLWLPGKHRDYVKKIAPGFRHVYSDMTKMLNESGDHLNINYNILDSEQIKDLRRRNVSVNLWGVNEPWLFSLLWCSEASSVTTNACHRFHAMAEPVWRLSPSTYRIIWICVDVGSLVIMLVIFLLQRNRKLRRRPTGWN